MYSWSMIHHMWSSPFPLHQLHHRYCRLISMASLASTTKSAEGICLCWVHPSPPQDYTPSPKRTDQRRVSEHVCEYWCVWIYIRTVAGLFLYNIVHVPLMGVPGFNFKLASGYRDKWVSSSTCGFTMSFGFWVAEFIVSHLGYLFRDRKILRRNCLCSN